MLDNTPSVSVLMPVYNTEVYVAEAIESILNQTYPHFELIIIDDASTDGTAEILEQYKNQDDRIIVLRNQANIGITNSLNKALSISKGNFIARMDADDVSYKNRFELQVDYLNNHHDILILGGSILVINQTTGIEVLKNYPDTPGLLRWRMTLGYGGVASHPAVMIRKSVFDLTGPYADIEFAQDHELWSRFLDYTNLPITNLKHILIKYREHTNSVSQSKKKLQNSIALEIRQNLIKTIYKNADLKSIEIFRNKGLQQYKDTEIEEAIIDWVRYYNLFVKKYHISARESKEIENEIIYRISKYVGFRSSFNGYVHILKILSSLRIRWTILLLLNKLLRKKFQIA